MNKIAIIVVAGSEKQNKCFWPSYFNSESGIEHDLIVIHRNMNYVPNLINKNGSVILENKIYSTGELPHKAFGAYREYWNRYQNKYDFFAFISDDVIIKSDNWLLESIIMLDKYDKLGFVGTQIFNGLNNQYPHESHCRAPAWFSKSKAIKNINWQFNSDHEGEMLLGDQFLTAGYFGVQVGCKIDIAYDSLENGGMFIGDHISSILETNLNYKLDNKFSNEEKQKIRNKFENMLYNSDDSMIIKSPYGHIGSRAVISQLQPFNGLIYDKSLNLAVGCYNSFNFNINCLKL